MGVVERAELLRSVIEQLATSLDDTNALEAAELFPRWDGDGTTYHVGDRVRYDDVLYKVLQDHTSQSTWTPPNSPSLFAKVLVPEDTIPVWEQPDSTNGYMTGDKVYYPDENGNVYESLIDNNVWSPEAYPAGWRMI